MLILHVLKQFMDLPVALRCYWWKKRWRARDRGCTMAGCTCPPRDWYTSAKQGSPLHGLRKRSTRSEKEIRI